LHPAKVSPYCGNEQSASVPAERCAAQKTRLFFYGCLTLLIVEMVLAESFFLGYCYVVNF